jgi:2-polyprenyl-3-methyl-5-hydroxy-6-metoxy-1,4-benzoquinol methylase
MPHSEGDDMNLQRDFEARWRRALAPTTGSLREELILELSEYFHLTREEVEDRLVDATRRFSDEWQARVSDPTDEAAVIRFYNESQTEVFDLAQWHAEDPIHYRSLFCADIASAQPGRRFLDYGSGIGSDALVFAAAGFDVTLADVSEPLLAFARWRCERRGYRVHTIDLKGSPLPIGDFDAVLCFDVLEHVLRPSRTLRRMSRSLKPGGLLFVHAPFGEDKERPMHLVHRDEITPRMRALGFERRHDLERFPEWIWAPRVYEGSGAGPLDRAGYFVYDVWMPGPVGTRLAGIYRALLRRRRTHRRGSLREAG